jgi:hypothetical protein
MRLTNIVFIKVAGDAAPLQLTMPESGDYPISDTTSAKFSCRRLSGSWNVAAGRPFG